MKKGLLLLFIFSTFNSFAQETTIGLRLGLNASKIKTEGFGNTKNIAAVNVFVPVNIPVAGNFSIQPELGIIQKGGKSSASDGSYAASAKVKQTYVEIPILAKYTMEVISELKACVFLGPSLGYALMGKTKLWENDGGDISEEVAKIDFKREGIRRIDIGFNLGAAALYELGDGDLTFDIRVQPGLSSMNKESSVAVKNMSVILSLGYIIKI